MNRFPILSKPLAGWLVIVLSLSTLLNIFVFQEPTELPKLIAWYIGLGIALFILIFSKAPLKLRMPKTVFVGLLVFVILLIFGSFFSYDVRNTIFGLYPRYTGSLIFFIAWVLSIIIFCAVKTADYIQILKFYAYLAVLISFWGIVQSFGIGFYEGLNAPVRSLIPSFLGNPNFSAMFVATALPILFWMVSLKEKWSAYLLWFYIGICMVGLILFNSRGAFLAVGVSMLIYAIMALLKKSWRQVIIIGLVMVAFTMIAGTFYYKTRIDVNDKDSSISSQTTTSRLVLWNFTANYILENPVFGTGLDNFFIAFRSNQDSVFSNKEWFDDAHNVFLQFAASAGIVPTIVFLSFISYALFLLFVRYKNSPNFDMAASVIAAIVAWIISGSFTPVALSNWILLAVLIAMAWHLSNDSIEFRRVKLIKLGSGLLAAGFIVLGTAMLSGEIFLWQSRVALDKENSNISLKLSKLSLDFFPLNTNAYINYLQSLLNTKQYENLDKEIQKFTAQHQRSSGVYQTAAEYYGQMYQQTQNEKYKLDSFRELDQMISLNNNYAYPYQIATLLHIRMGDYDGAQKFATKSIILSDNHFNSWMMYAKIQYHLGRRVPTQRALELAFKEVQDMRLKIAINKLREGKDLKDIAFPLEF